MSDGVREAARVLVLDAAGRILLLQGADPDLPDAGFWWFTPGGGLEADELAADAARREVLEETGAVLGELDGPVWARTTEFDFGGVHFHQHEVYFVARTAAFVVSIAARTDQELKTLTAARWWTLDELERTEQTVHPENLAGLVRAALAG